MPFAPLCLRPASAYGLRMIARARLFLMILALVAAPFMAALSMGEAVAAPAVVAGDHCASAPHCAPAVDHGHDRSTCIAACTLHAVAPPAVFARLPQPAIGGIRLVLPAQDNVTATFHPPPLPPPRA